MNENSSFFLRWVLVGAVGWTMGRFLIGAMVGDVMESSELKLTWGQATNYGWSIMVVATGMLVSVSQWFLLPESVAQVLGDWKWGLASVVGWIIGGAVAIAVLGDELDLSAQNLVLGALISGALAGATQWLVLRQCFRWASGWIVANVISMGVVSNFYLSTEGCMPLFAAGAVAGAVTAGTLLIYLEKGIKDRYQA